MLKYKLGLVIVLSLTACVSAPLSPTPEPSASPSPMPSVAATPSKTFPLQGWQPEYTQFVRDNVTQAMIDSDPVTVLCPGYTRDKGRDAWAAILHAVAFAESGYNRLSRYVEPGLGTDELTGRQVTSEGLMQLSYDDVINYPSAKGCGIDWSKDKNKSDSDPTKTIFDPLVNLRCSIAIMDGIIQSKASYFQGRTIMDKLSSYWATLRVGSKLDQSCDTRVKLAEIYPACKTTTSDCSK